VRVAGLTLSIAAALAPLWARSAEPLGYTSCMDRTQAAPRTAQPRPAPQRSTTEAERDLEELAEAVRRYDQIAREYRQEVQSLVEKKHEDQRRTLSDSYEYAIRNLEAADRKDRQETIAQLEAFLARYPREPEYTPDAMMRLAELLLESSNDAYAAAVAEWRDKVRESAAEKREPPPEPVRSYDRSIDLYRRVLAEFPGYRLEDAAWYELAYALGEVGRNEESERTYLALVQRFPQSRFVPEAWVRLGDVYFDQTRPGALQKAADAYARMQAFPDHPLYARALYKLGWTYYRIDDFQRAVEAFTRLLDQYVAESKATGRPPAGDVWPEAIQYIAISFADDRGGGVERARAYYDGLGGRPYEAEIYLRLGDVLFDQTKYAASVAAYKAFLARNPLAPEAPRIHARIVLAWQRDRQLDKEAEELEALVSSYGETSAWWQKNKGDPDVIREARELANTSMVRAASFHHAQAQAYKKAGRLDEAVTEYREAARAYAQFLSRFPHSKMAHEIAFQYGDALYNSLQFEKAALVYAGVRDDPADARYRAEAGLSAVISWEAEVTRLRRAGQLPERKVLISKDRSSPEVPAPEPLAPPLQGLVRDSDAFLVKVPDSPKAPAIAYKAGEVFYTHNHFPEARCRLEEVVARWPRSEEASFAANLIIESHLAVRDWAGVEQAAARLQQLEVSQSPAVAGSMQKFKLGGRFNRASQLMEDKRYDEAAQAFASLVEEDPRNEFADKALYNAASCHERARRFESALRLYERVYREYPKSSLAPDALFRVAYNSENTYDFERAVERYLYLVERYPQSKYRKDALYNAARSQENLQRYDAAAKTFARYAQLYPDAEDAARTQFHAARIYEKTRDYGREIQALRDFDRRFARTREVELLVQARLRMGLAYKELGQDQAARREFSAAVAEFGRRGLKPDSNPAAAAAAAEAQFRLAEYEFEKFDRIALPATANPRKLKGALEAKLRELKKVAPLYNEVKKYKRPDWTLAAFYRQAYLLERLAQTLYDAPVPPEFKRPGQEEYLAAYQDRLAQAAQPYEEQAVAVYVQAYNAARELRVKNEWTRRTAESLARYRPAEYPVLKEARGRMQLEDRSPAPLLETPDGAPRKPAQPVAAESAGGAQR
jgi:TolA-binding protein